MTIEQLSTILKALQEIGKIEPNYDLVNHAQNIIINELNNT